MKCRIFGHKWIEMRITVYNDPKLWYSKWHCERCGQEDVPFSERFKLIGIMNDRGF